jgi:hypothetical protein
MRRSALREQELKPVTSLFRHVLWFQDRFERVEVVVAIPFIPLLYFGRTFQIFVRVVKRIQGGYSFAKKQKHRKSPPRPQVWSSLTYD